MKNWMIARTNLLSFFGLVLYEMATGQQAFPGKTGAVIRDAVLNVPAVPVRQLNQHLPVKLESIIGRALEKDRARRYQSATELRADLEQIQAGGVKNLIAEKPDRLAPASRFASVTRGAALAVLAILAGGITFPRSVFTIAQNGRKD